MNVDLYSVTGQKAGTLELPSELFETDINQGLMHQALVMQRSNRRRAIAHAKGRSEVAGSTRKLYAQKHTGRARRGSIRSPLLRGGGKAFGPRKGRNFTKDMPKAMRHAAIKSCLSFQAKRGAIIGLESYSETIKTKEAAALLRKLPVEYGRRILIVMPAPHRQLALSVRNIPNVKTLPAAYLNPEDVLVSRHLIFLKGAEEKAREVFGKKAVKVKAEKKQEEAKAKPKTSKRTVSKKSPSDSSAS